MPKNALAPTPVNALIPASHDWLDWRTYTQLATDPFDVSEQAFKESDARYSKKGTIGGQNDAFRHILGTAVLAQRRGEPYAKFITDLHESELLPGGLGARDHPKAQVDMDLYNNQIGLEIARKAKDYNELLRMAQEYVNSGKAQTVNPR